MWGRGWAPNPRISPAGSQHSSAHHQVFRPSIKPHHPCSCSLAFPHYFPIWVFSAHASLLCSTWSTLPFSRLSAPLWIENTHPEQLPCSFPLRSWSLWQLTWEQLLYLLRADLYISNTCKLSATANRPSLLILTTEGALLYFSINTPPHLLLPLPASSLPSSNPHATYTHNPRMQHKSHPFEIIWSVHIALSPQLLYPALGSACYDGRMRESHSSCSVKI